MRARIGARRTAASHPCGAWSKSIPTAILAAVLTLAGCADAPSPRPPAGSGPGGTASPTRVPVVGAWSRHELGRDGPMLSSLVVGGPGFIGGGASGEDAAIWTSSDGLAWTRTAGAPSGPGRVNGLAAGGPGFVAVGGMRGAAGGEAQPGPPRTG